MLVVFIQLRIGSHAKNRWPNIICRSISHTYYGLHSPHEINVHVLIRHYYQWWFCKFFRYLYVPFWSFNRLVGVYPAFPICQLIVVCLLMHSDQSLTLFLFVCVACFCVLILVFAVFSNSLPHNKFTQLIIIAQKNIPFLRVAIFDWCFFFSARDDFKKLFNIALVVA